MSQKERLDFGELAMSAMHDIQSPLAVLQMATQSLQEVNERYFTFANEAVQQIRDIATDFMERYQMPEQTMIEQCDTIALAPMLLTSVLLKQQLFSTRDTHFECQTPNAADHIYVRANSSLLKRLLSNLLNNAIEAIEHKGHITVSLSYDTERVNFSIKDNGCGINKRDLKTILTHGISLGKNKNEAGKGYGIGLTTARTWLASWHGTLEVCSKKRCGTTISMNLPRYYQK